jgi:hypothetical protein
LSRPGVLRDAGAHRESVELDGEADGAQTARISSLDMTAVVGENGEIRRNGSFPACTRRRKERGKDGCWEHPRRGSGLPQSPVRDGGPGVRVSAFWSIETKGKEIEDFPAFYTPSGVCWRSTMSAATADVALGVAVSTSCARRGEDEDDDLPPRLYPPRRGTGCGLGWLTGCCWASSWTTDGLRCWALLAR